MSARHQLSKQLAIVALVAISAARASADSPLFEELTTKGVTLSSGAAVALPKPIIADGMSPEEQKKAVEAAADKYPLDRFLRDAVVSPYVLNIESVEDSAGKRTGQRIDFCFVAYGSLDKIHSEDLLNELAGVKEEEADSELPATARALEPAELAARKLEPAKTDSLEESFVAIDVPILDNVQLSGVGLAVQEIRPESILVALRLEDRFVDDTDFPNQWRPIKRGPDGKPVIGEATPYAGMGGYIKVTKLTEPPDALFVECHIAFEEPYGWFNGKNLLRSKLPLVVQDHVRTFRRKLSKVSGR